MVAKNQAMDGHLRASSKRRQGQGQPIPGRFVNAIKLEELLDERFGDNYLVEVRNVFSSSPMSTPLLWPNQLLLDAVQ